MAGGRDERVRELFFVPSMADPTDEGEVVLYNNDLVALLGGQIKSLTTGVVNFDDILLDDDGRIVYVGNGLFVTRG